MTETSNRTLPVLWRRNDLDGFETCRIVDDGEEWRIEGAAVLVFDGAASRIDYEVTCDRAWVTRWAAVSGWVGGQDLDLRVTRRPNGSWDVDGAACAAVSGCVDVDLNFSPSTNLIPIRRLDLGIGERAEVRAAWLRFPSFEIDVLEQTYTRVAERVYRYESGHGRFTADVTVDTDGLVIDYGPIWTRVVAR